MYILYTIKVLLKKVLWFSSHPRNFSTNYLNTALFKYGFKRMWEEDKVVLPDPHGASSAIEEANNEVRDVLSRGSKLVPYL